MGAVAAYTVTPFVFPALGPTIFMLFYSPHDPAASPRNTVLGHAIGIGTGLVGLAAFGLLDGGSPVSSALSGRQLGAVALSLGLTTALMAATGFIHPPAGSTTLTVSLGLLEDLWHVGVLGAAVLCVVTVAWAFDRLQERLMRGSLQPHGLKASDGARREATTAREALSGDGVGICARSKERITFVMDCREVAELLDAYALGAAEREEARALTEHVADCVRCWDELTEAQRTAALLALSVPLRRAGPSLRQRVIGRAGLGGPLDSLGEMLSRLRRSWS